MDRPCSNFFLHRASGCQVINVVIRSGSIRKNTSGSSSVFICMEELKVHEIAEQASRWWNYHH